MTQSPTSKSRKAWEDRFSTPSAASLIKSIDEPVFPAAEYARVKLLAVEGLREDVVWQGVWKWTLTYTHSADSDRGWIFLIPDPSRFRLSMPMSVDLIQELPLKKLSKFSRDALVHAPVVGRTRWPSWDVQTKTQVDDCLELARLKLQLFASRPQSSSV